MLQELRDHFWDFGDALILGFTYSSPLRALHIEDNSLEMTLHCMNHSNSSKFIILKLLFTQVVQFQIKEEVVDPIFGALIKEEDGIILIDFFPIIYSSLEDLREDPESPCKVRFRAVTYTIVEELE